MGLWKTWTTASGLPSNRIRGLYESSGARDDGLWIATDAGLARLRNGAITTFGEAAGLPNLDTEAFCETDVFGGEKTLVVGTSNGIARRDGERFVAIPIPKALLGHRIDDIVESPGLHGTPALWIASYGAGIAVYEKGQWTLLDVSSGLPSNVEVFTNSRADDGSPALWIGTEGGLVRFEHGRFTLYDERSGLPIRLIWKVLETTSPGGLEGHSGSVPGAAAWCGFRRTSGPPSTRRPAFRRAR